VQLESCAICEIGMPFENVKKHSAASNARQELDMRENNSKAAAQQEISYNTSNQMYNCKTSSPVTLMKLH